MEIGSVAPDFTLTNQHGQDVTLSSFRGKSAVVLVFYPLAFSGICGGEMCELRDNIAMFRDQRVELLAISVDSRHTLRAWADAEGFDFSLLADFWPHGGVAQQYGVFLDDKGFANRATFVIGPEGVLRAQFVTEPGQPRSLADYRSALDALEQASA